MLAVVLMSVFCFLTRGAMFALRSVIQVLSVPEIIKLFSCSTQLSMNFPQLIKTETLNNIDISLA